MIPIEVSGNSLESFIQQNSANVVLFFSPADASIATLLELYSDVAATFEHNIGFATIDLPASGGVELMERGLEILTPSIHLYAFGQLIREEYGARAILDILSHEVIVNSFGRTSSGAQITW